jgi:hypothetical protein
MSKTKKVTITPEEPNSATLLDHPDLPELRQRGQGLLAKTPMTPRHRLGVGIYLTVLGLALLAVTPQAWSLATQVVTSGEAEQLSLWGFEFRATPEIGLMSIVILMGLIGSATVMTLVFALRAGNGTLEDSFVWWYVTRPITAAGLAVLFYMTAIAGLLNLGTISGASALVIAAALAALAGLFTDQVLEKMRKMLGLLPYHEPASGKDPATEK